MEVVVYSKDRCINCEKALLLLKEFNLKVVKLGRDVSMNDFFSKFPDAKTVPQIEINGSYIGGYSDLVKWLEITNGDDNF